MSKVFIIERPYRDVDISGLNEYGEIVEIFKDYHEAPSPFEPSQYVNAIREKLIAHDFDNTTDRIAIVGKILATSLLLAAIGSHYESVRMLLYDAHSSAYVERVLDIPVHVS